MIITTTFLIWTTPLNDSGCLGIPSAPASAPPRRFCRSSMRLAMSACRPVKLWERHGKPVKECLEEGSWTFLNCLDLFSNRHSNDTSQWPRTNEKHRHTTKTVRLGNLGQHQACSTSDRRAFKKSEASILCSSKCFLNNTYYTYRRYLDGLCQGVDAVEIVIQEFSSKKHPFFGTVQQHTSAGTVPDANYWASHALLVHEPFKP